MANEDYTMGTAQDRRDHDVAWQQARDDEAAAVKAEEEEAALAAREVVKQNLANALAVTVAEYADPLHNAGFYGIITALHEWLDFEL